MIFSHSRVECFENCPFRYKLKYLDNLEALPDTDRADNALYLGTALHTGIEQGVESGIRAYLDNYPVLTDAMVVEMIKLEHWIPKVREIVDEMTSEPIFEREIRTKDFVGYIDLLVPVGKEGQTEIFDMYDFKYSNNVDRYIVSRQLHEYKFHYEKMNPFHKIRNMGFIFVPKTAIRQREKSGEDIWQFRTRLKQTLEKMEVKVSLVDYEPEKVIEFYQLIKRIQESDTFDQKLSRLCDFCEFKMFCKEGETYMLLPKNQRRIVTPADRMKLWVYGAPFTGKTTLANAFPDPIFINTDGNLNSFDAPYVEVKDTMNGRQVVTAWENFEEVVDELIKGSEFKTVVVDLVEDCYEHCRKFCYKKLGIEHESDSNFKAWDVVTNTFLAALKKLCTSGYNVVLISHEDLSRDITRKSGDKITGINPNLRAKIATKLSGMVDIVARACVDGDVRTLQFKSDDVVFGGGRLKLKTDSIPLTYTALKELYESQSAVAPKKITLEDVIATAKPICEKHGQEELLGIMKDKFGVTSFKALSENQFEAVMETLKEYEASK